MEEEETRRQGVPLGRRLYALYDKLSCTEMDMGTDTDTGRETDTTNFEKCGIRYGKETTADLYIYIKKAMRHTYFRLPFIN